MRVVPTGRKVYQWFFSQLVEFGTVSLIAYIITRELFSKEIKISLWILLYNVMLFFIGLIAVSCAVGIFWFKSNMVTSWNQLLGICRSEEGAKLGKE